MVVVEAAEVGKDARDVDDETRQVEALTQQGGGESLRRRVNWRDARQAISSHYFFIPASLCTLRPRSLTVFSPSTRLVFFALTPFARTPSRAHSETRTGRDKAHEFGFLRFHGDA